MKEYRAKDSRLTNKEANILGTFVEKTFSGKVKPKELVKAARNKSCPVHYLFEWDNEIAGEKYRLWQARYYLGAIEVKITETEYAPAYYSVKLMEGDKTPTYTNFDQSVTSSNLWEQVLHQGMREALYWKEKYGKLQTFQPIVEQIDKIKRRLDAKRSDRIDSKETKKDKDVNHKKTTSRNSTARTSNS